MNNHSILFSGDTHTVQLTGAPKPDRERSVQEKVEPELSRAKPELLGEK